MKPRVYGLMGDGVSGTSAVFLMVLAFAILPFCAKVVITTFATYKTSRVADHRQVIKALIRPCLYVKNTKCG
jgi:hypothetical protein